MATGILAESFWEQSQLQRLNTDQKQVIEAKILGQAFQRTWKIYSQAEIEKAENLSELFTTTKQDSLEFVQQVLAEYEDFRFLFQKNLQKVQQTFLSKMGGQHE